jgi:hypothetical protein
LSFHDLENVAPPPPKPVGTSNAMGAPRTAGLGLSTARRADSFMKTRKAAFLFLASTSKIRRGRGP